jgi:uncharacterized protein (DUF2236 family)
VAIATLPSPRTTIAKAVRERLAGDFEAQHAEIWRDGQRWFSEDDAIWRVHADASMFIGAVRALLLQALHPVAHDPGWHAVLCRRSALADVGPRGRGRQLPQGVSGFW